MLSSSPGTRSHLKRISPSLIAWDRESYEDMVLHSALRITPSAVLATIPAPSVDTHSSLMRREPSTVLSVQTEWDRESYPTVKVSSCEPLAA